MTHGHIHRWQLGTPEARRVQGRCRCGRTKSFAAYMATDAHLHSRKGKASRAQVDEATALLSHALSLVAVPR